MSELIYNQHPASNIESFISMFTGTVSGIFSSISTNTHSNAVIINAYHTSIQKINGVKTVTSGLNTLFAYADHENIPTLKVADEVEMVRQSEEMLEVYKTTLSEVNQLATAKDPEIQSLHRNLVESLNQLCHDSSLLTEKIRYLCKSDEWEREQVLLAQSGDIHTESVTIIPSKDDWDVMLSDDEEFTITPKIAASIQRYQQIKPH